MKTVKFISTDPAQKQFGAEVRKNVYAYFKEQGISTKGNAAMFLKAVIMLTLYVAPFVIILTVPVNALGAILLVILMGIGAAGVGMSVMHDAAHGAFSKKKWVNTLFASSINLLGTNTFNWMVQHNIKHHTFTHIYGFDPDIDTKAVIRLNKHAPLKKYHRAQYIYAYFFYGLMTIARLAADLNQLKGYNREGITRGQGRSPVKEMLRMIVTKIIFFGILIGLPIWFTDFTWWQVLIGFCIVQVVSGMIMSTIFQMAHVVKGNYQVLPDNAGVVNNEWAVHELKTTSDFARYNYFLNWYIGGLNFQIEHHLFPNVCHIHYPKIAPIVEQTAEQFGYRYNLKPSFSDAFVSHVQMLKMLGRAA